jgi:hypothetical protein
MEIPESVRCEWHDDHRLSAVSLAWFRAHGDVGDDHPVRSGIDAVRRHVDTERSTRGG